MLIDCDTCQVRGDACGDCVVTVLLGPPTELGIELDEVEQAAVMVLAHGGLIPPLRLVPGGVDASVDATVIDRRGGRQAG